MPRVLDTRVPWRDLAAFLAASYAALLVGGALTPIGPWYEALAKPAWTPPGAVIGAVWWTLFTLLGVAMAVGWNAGPKGREGALLLGAYGANLALNVAWSALFFTLQNPAAALVEVVFLELSVAALALALARRSRRAGLLLAPYLAWVGFAAYLNATIVALNA